MKKLYVDLTHLNDGSDTALQALKIFRNAHSDEIDISAIGEKKDLISLSQSEYQKLPFSEEEIDNYSYLKKIFNEAEEDECYIGCLDERKLLKEFKYNDDPYAFFTFPTKNPKRRSLLAYYLIDQTPEKYVELIDKIIPYSDFLNLKNEHEMYFLVPSKNEELLPEKYIEMNKVLSNCSNYKGFISPYEVLSKGSDIIFSFYLDKEFILSSTYGAIDTYNSIKDEYNNHSFVGNLGNMLTKKTYSVIEQRIDKKMNSNGICVKGFNLEIILVNKTTNLYGFASCLQRGNKIIEFKQSIKEKI